MVNRTSRFIVSLGIVFMTFCWSDARAADDPLANLWRCAPQPPTDPAQKPKPLEGVGSVLDELGRCHIGLHGGITDDSQGASLGYSEAGQGSSKNCGQSQFALVWIPHPLYEFTTTNLFLIWSMDGIIDTQSA